MDIMQLARSVIGGAREKVGSDIRQMINPVEEDKNRQQEMMMKMVMGATTGGDPKFSALQGARSQALKSLELAKSAGRSSNVIQNLDKNYIDIIKQILKFKK